MSNAEGLRPSAQIGKVLIASCLFLLTACTGSPSSSSNNAAAPARPTTRPDPVISSESWTYNGKLGKNIHTANYSIYTTQNNPILTTRMPTFVEAALRNYTSALGTLPPPPGELETFIMSTRGEWERLTKQLMGEQAEIYLQIKRGGYAANGRGIYYDIGTADTFSIASHEGWHQYTQRTFREGLPTWLEEGIATFMEGHRWEGASPKFAAWSNTERFDQLRAAASRGTLFTLQELISTSPQELLGGPVPTSTPKTSSAAVHSGDEASRAFSSEDRLLTYYAQIWALVHFFSQGEAAKYHAGLESVVGDAASGKMRAKIAGSLGEAVARNAVLTRRGPAVLLAYFGGDTDTLGAEYSHFIEKVVRPGSRGMIVQGRSPLE